MNAKDKILVLDDSTGEWNEAIVLEPLSAQFRARLKGKSERLSHMFLFYAHKDVTWKVLPDK